MANESLPAPPGFGWIDSAARIITQVGFPIVACCVLLWFVLFKFMDQIDKITLRLESNAQLAETLTHQNQDSLSELKRQTVALEEIANGVRFRSQSRESKP